MEFAAMGVSKIQILRVDPGEDLLASIEAFCEQANIEQAVVLGGYGTLVSYHLHWSIHNRIPTRNYFERGEGGTELLSMSGMVVDSKPHIHMTLSNKDGAFGGHLEPGCIAYVLCEVFFAEVEGAHLSRERVAVSVAGMGEGKISRLIFGQEPERG